MTAALAIVEPDIIAKMPATDGTDSEVIRLLRELKAGRNVEENFRRLFDRYHRGVSGSFRRYGFSPEDTRDLTQEVFSAVYTGLDDLRNEGAFCAWLSSIVRHVRCRHLERLRKSPRALRARAGGDSDEGEEDRTVENVRATEPDALRRLIEMERVEAMRDAIKELPARVQECLRARVVDGLKFRDIGKRLGISENTAAVHVHRGLKSLKARAKKIFGGTSFNGGI